jgi:DNA-binding NarL/FixJ family response regulator
MNFTVFSDSFIDRAGIIFLLNYLFPNCKITEAENFDKLHSFYKKKQNEILILFECSSVENNILEKINSLDIQQQNQLVVILDRFIPEKHKILIDTGRNISFLLKRDSEDEFRAAFKLIIAGNRYICNTVSNIVLNKVVAKNTKKEKHKLLTVTETEILKEITLGKTTKEIATIRNVSIHTVMTHRKNIFRKIEVNSVYEATKYAMRAGIVELAEYYI